MIENKIKYVSKKEYKEIRLFTLGLFITCLVMVFLISINIKDYYVTKDIEQWIPTKAVVLDSAIKEKISTSYISPAYSVLKVKYKYNVLGKFYISDKYTYSISLKNSVLKYDKDLLQKYKKGNIIKAYYNKNNPEMAVIVNSRKTLSFTSFYISLLVLILLLPITVPCFKLLKTIKIKED